MSAKQDFGPIDLRHARDALFAIDPNCSRDDWHTVGRAAIAAHLSVDDILSWSKPAANFSGEQDVRAAFRTIKPNGKTGPGTLWKFALAAGWRPPQPEKTENARQVANGSRQTHQRPAARRSWESAADVFGRFEPATEAHPYIIAKQGLPAGLRVVPEGDQLCILRTSVAGWLAVPVVPLDGDEPVSVQFIPPPGKGKKLNLPGASMAGVFIVGELQSGGTAYLCEGIGQAWACWKATGHAAVCCFGWGNFGKAAAELRQRDAVAKLVLVPDAGKEDEARKIAAEQRAAVACMPEGSPSNFDANDYAQAEGFDALEILLAAAGKPGEAPRCFDVVPIADLGTVEPNPLLYWWDGYVPAGVVTLLGAHGGTGKSTLALMLGIHVALGLPLFGVPTRRANVAYFSAEDGAELLRYRVHQLCRGLGIDPAAIADHLHILDASDADPALYREDRAQGIRAATTTRAFAELRDYVEAHDVQLLLIDNASDTFDASEIDRARVRGFMRELAGLAHEGRAVVLLAHVDKSTARGLSGGTDSYSGSTAWHNSARSRLFLSREKDSTLLLEHQKHNLGRMREPLRLIWPEGGIPQLDAPANGFVQHIADRAATKAVLRLIDEFTARGEFVTTATTSRTHAARLLGRESTFPKLKDPEVFDLLRKAERGGQLERVQFKGSDRHLRERWQVTATGAEFAGIAAATAATTEVTAQAVVPAEPCGDCGDFAGGVIGGNRAAESSPGVAA